MRIGAPARGLATLALAAPSGCGAASGNMVRSAAIGGGLTVASEVLGGVDNDTRRTSQLIAKKLSVLFVRQRWIPPGAVVK